MGVISFIVLVAIAYLIWRISDQMPDILFRLSEIQRDIAELRRQLETSEEQTAAEETSQPEE